MTQLPILTNIIKFIVDPAISLLFGVALLYFLYGVAVFIYKSDNETSLNEGKSHIIWGIVGLFIMISAFGILQLICNTVQCN